MEVIEFVVKFGDHLLDVLGLLLLIQLVDDGLFDILLSVSIQNVAIRTDHELGGYLRSNWFLFHYLVNRCVFVMLEHLDVPVVDVIDDVVIDFAQASYRTHTKWSRSALHIFGQSILTLDIKRVSIWLNELLILRDDWGDVDWLLRLILLSYLTLAIVRLNASSNHRLSRLLLLGTSYVLLVKNIFVLDLLRIVFAEQESLL